MNKRPYEIRDPIHGLIELSQKELDIINTKAFQRLRRIRQLAMAFLVYPGTLHTRFDHSIGVMHIAGRICEQLKSSAGIETKECDGIRLAALLHDIGHGPFSHVSEYLLDLYAPNQASENSDREKIHERVTVDIVKSESEIKEVLSSEERKFIIDMIVGKPTRDFKRDIISSDLDADKMDYLLRDSYFAGVKYGTYDLDKIVESCRVHFEEDESYLAISDEGNHALEQLLLAKHHMTQQVYRHRVRSISDAMIVRGIELAINQGNQELQKLYQYRENSNFIDNYIEYHDERLIDILMRCDQEKGRRIFERLYRRQLFKMIGELPLKRVDSAPAKRRLLQMHQSQRRQWEEGIARHLRIDPDEVIVNKLQTGNPNYGSRSYSINPEAVMIYDEAQSGLRSLSRYGSELVLVRPPTDEADLETVQVCAPQDERNSQQFLLQLQEKVQEILLSS
ncbi:MAG: HD domain-containing protein [Candidatus Poribacteria bacterium]|nr:HD domain-containing protein [Candidatus Poribacteria bacterium]